MIQVHLQACPGFADISVDEKKIEFLLCLFFFFFNWRNLIEMTAQLSIYIKKKKKIFSIKFDKYWQQSQ